MNLPIKTMLKSKYKYLLCRLCLCTNSTLADIYGCEEGQEFSPADCISDLLQFNVSKTDGYPQLVCLECLNKLYDFKGFKERCQSVKSKFEMDYHSNPKFLHVIRSEEKEGNQEKPLMKGDECNMQNDHKYFSNDPLKQEEKEFSSPYVKVKADQDKSKRFSKEMATQEQTENSISLVPSSPRSSSFPSCICIIESDCEHNERIPNPNQITSKENSVKMPKRVKNDKREFCCKVCQKSYAQKSTLTTHMNIHLGLKPFQCEFCNMGFLQSSKLKLHALRKHAERKFQCTLCPRRFPTENSLARHTRTHREYRPFQCKMCMCGFYTEEALERHTDKHALEVPFQCDECRKVFDHKRKISRHIWQSHMIKPYSCSICSRTFIKESVLKEHMTLHTGEKNYMCEVCGKAFRKKRYLTIHERVHTGEKPYLCELCNKRFTQRGSLVAHMKLHNR